MDYQSYYQSIQKPFFSPPEWVFGFAWGVIYPLMAIALVLIIYGVFRGKTPTYLLLLYLLNIVANLIFTPIQLSLGSTLLATLDILVVLSTLAYLELKIFHYSKSVFILLLPYLAWGTFATVLQITILILNS